MIAKTKNKRRPSLSMVIPCGCLIALVATAVVLLAPPPMQSQTLPATPNILVVYDNEGQWGWLGEIYSLKLQNQLGHFDAKVTRTPLANYKSGDIAANDAAFYVASVWNESPLPAAFQTDLENTVKPFVWMGVNLWRYAWDLSTYAPRTQFTDRYGFQLESYSSEKHPTVVYKNTKLEKDPFDVGLSRVRITEPSKAVVRAVCLDQGGTEWPYIVQSGKFWFVADMPMISTTFENRSLAFSDLLHDMLGINHAENQRAFFRIEDVAAVSDIPTLKSLGNVLTDLKVPFTISLIPEYRDWSGIYNGGVSETVRITKNSPVSTEMRRWTGIGGQVLQHGTTHQIDGLMNPYTGVSGDDYEFYRVTADEQGFLTLVGALPGDSASWARNRVTRGLNILKNAGFNPVGWLTPHYLASPVDYTVFASIFPFACDRGIFFFKDAAGKTQATELNSPYIYRDTYGLKRMPETIGYIDPYGWYGIQAPTTPEDLLKRAKALKVVRDGWAGFYFHWYLNPEDLRTTVTGLKSLGFTFTPLSGSLK
ncbi:MAG: DUF2334 domain-containing protein [bacterium]